MTSTDKALLKRLFAYCESKDMSGDETVNYMTEVSKLDEEEVLDFIDEELNSERDRIDSDIADCIDSAISHIDDTISELEVSISRLKHTRESLKMTPTK